MKAGASSLALGARFYFYEKRAVRLNGARRAV
jgi:hypothetical protein